MVQNEANDHDAMRRESVNFLLPWALDLAELLLSQVLDVGNLLNLQMPAQGPIGIEELHDIELGWPNLVGEMQ